jgi:hypothetical protein
MFSPHKETDLSPHDKLLLRLAGKIHAAITARSRPLNDFQYEVRQMADYFDRIRSLQTRIDFARARGFRKSVEKACLEMVREVRNLRSDSSTVCAKGEALVNTPQQTSIRQIFEDLKAIDENMEGGLRWDHKLKHLYVTTDAIDLRDDEHDTSTYLGEFEIRLQIPQIFNPDQTEYGVVITALDPHPSARKGQVTHPHVNDEHLCMGDGKMAIFGAVQQGRLYDVFEIIKSILNTYNPDSPYVKLEEWEYGDDEDDSSCDDCGYSTDELYTCNSCGHSLCSECSGTCHHCEESYCNEHLSTCEECDESVCEGCMTKCPDCEVVMCKSCLENHQCETVECSHCHEDVIKVEAVKCRCGSYLCETCDTEKKCECLTAPLPPIPPDLVKTQRLPLPIEAWRAHMPFEPAMSDEPVSTSGSDEVLESILSSTPMP